MANQFFGFSPEAFEQFVRVLALSVFGPGVTTFGNGPDGGREATFRGEVPYPYPPATQWSGYGVIQAKCKEKPETSQKDQEWALKQLDGELATFVQSKKRDPKPEYYIFVTNVELSSAAGGGKDECDKLAHSYYDKLPLKGHAIWDANQLDGFLTRYEELRRRFTAYLTTGDVLAVMLADIQRRRPNATLILTSFLERELRADEASRLDQAGNRTEEQLRLARLFFDLPASPEAQLVPPKEQADSTGRLPHGVLWELLQSGLKKLDPKTVCEQEASSPQGIAEQFPTRYVLLGGPGSGKSTIGQFLAQIHRSALLIRREPHLLETRTHQIIQETRELCEREDLPWPATPRYPFRIELNRLAKALASKEQDHVECLGSYLLNELKRTYSMAYEDLLEWLVAYPWLLILDGLDEVPLTSNRDILVKAVNDFLAEARQAGADLFVVATSRQQGYAGEFASENVAFRHVLPLSTARALRYVEQYAEARFGVSDPNRAKDMISKLRESAKRELTAQLMTSPLQVTFMATVVAARGDPGEDRWQLLDSYYRTIYDRERQKAVPPYDTVLSKQQTTIDRLHHDIGFWLQYRGETIEGTSVSLPIAQFERLVDSYLSETGREGTEKKQMVKLITEAARQRLVFLTSRMPEELSFDVRSLQEYMAAECLMTGDPEIVKNRLRAIAPATYWRNVFLFATSRCFADTRSRHLQDPIRLLCEDLNSSNDALMEATKVGSELAIDVLQSGAVAQNPKYARHLAKTGLALLSQPYLINETKEGPPLDHRLAVVYHSDLKAAYHQELELRVGQTNISRALGAWPLLVRLISRDIEWAIGLAENHWPSDPQAQITILRQIPPDLARVQWLRNKLSEIIPNISPSEAGGILDILQAVRGVSDPLGALCQIIRGRGDLRIPLKICQGDKGGINLRVTPVFPQDSKEGGFYRIIASMRRSHPGWLPFILTSKFLRSPNAETLSKILFECADGGWLPSDKFCLYALPWPLASYLYVVQSLEELRDLALQLEKGTLGDIADWKNVEEGWKSEGVKLGDFVGQPGCPLSFDSTIHNLSRQFTLQNWSIDVQSYSDSVLQALYDTALLMEANSGREKIVCFLCLTSLSTGGVIRCVDPSQFRALIESVTNQQWWHRNCIGYPDRQELVASWLEFFTWLSSSDILSPRYYSDEYDSQKHDDAWCETFQKAFISGHIQHALSQPSDHPKDKGRLGLLRLLGRLASAGQTITVIPSEMLNLDSFSEPRFKLAALLVHLTQPKLTEYDSKYLADQTAALLEPPAEPGADYLVFKTAEAHLDRAPAIGHFLLRLREKIPTKAELGVAECERLLRRVLRKRASDLQFPDQLHKLQLPIVPPN